MDSITPLTSVVFSEPAEGILEHQRRFCWGPSAGQSVLLVIKGGKPPVERVLLPVLWAKKANNAI